jgi:hypothetical protein
MALGLVAVGLLGGCSVSGLSPSASIEATASASASASAEETSTAVATMSALPSPLARCPGNSAQTATASAAPSVVPAPAGAWTCLDWIAAGKAFPQTPTAGSGDLSVLASVFGWSRGYVGFRSLVDTAGPDGSSAGIVATSSPDGLHWTATRPMDVSGLGVTDHMTTVVEGPAGLLAASMYMPGACGGPASIDALWISPDGLTWTRVQLPDDFVSASVYRVDAGSTGYIAEGTLKDGNTQAVWLSKDGRSWSRAALPKAAIGEVILQGATDFSGGYVLSGAIRGDEGCGGYRYVTPSLWWSADGQAWTRSKLNGAVPASDSWMTLTRISDRSLMAIANEWDQTSQTSSEKVWFSTDGQSWNLVEAPSNLLGADVITDGKRGLIAVNPTTDEAALPVIATVGDDLSVSTLSQAGDVPRPGFLPIANCAIGPSGVVMLNNDGSELWLGVPAAS